MRSQSVKHPTFSKNNTEYLAETKTKEIMTAIHKKKFRFSMNIADRCTYNLLKQ